MLPYTINRTFIQRAVLQRDTAVKDDLGAAISQGWTSLVTVPCEAWWDKQSARGPGREDVSTASTVAIGQGGAFIPGGTDVSTGDRILKITDKAGNVLYNGPFNIVAVLPHASYPALIELAFKEPGG